MRHLDVRQFLALFAALAICAQEAPPVAGPSQIGSIWGTLRKAERAYADGFYEQSRDDLFGAWQLIVAAAGSPSAQSAETAITFATKLIGSLVALGEVKQAAAINTQLEELIKDQPAPEEKKLLATFWRGRLLLLHSTPQPKPAALLFQEVVRRSTDEALRVEATVWLGTCLLLLERWDDAETALAAAVQHVSDPKLNARAQRGLIDIYLAKEDFVRANELLETYLKNPVSDNERVELGMKRIQLLLGLFDPKAAFAFYRETFGNSADYLEAPEHYPIMRSLAQALAREKEYESALLVIERVMPLVEGDTRKQELLLDLADVSFQAAHPADALRHYRRFLQLHPEDPRRFSVHMKIAETAASIKDHKQAIDAYQQIVSDPDAPAALRYQSAHRIASIHLEHLKSYPEAIKMFLVSAELPVGPAERAHAVILAANTEVLNRNYASAAERYAKVADQYADTPFACEARFNQGESMYKAEQWKAAVEAYSKYLAACKDADSTQTAMLHKGLALGKAAEFAETVTAFQAYAEAYPKSDEAPMALFEAAKAAISSDQKDSAMKLLAAVISNYPQSRQYPEALYMRTYLHFQYGKYKEAVEDGFAFREKFSETHPHLAPDVNLWLGDHFANEQRYADAEKLFLDIRKRFKDSPKAPLALYEAAKNAYQQSMAENGDFSKSLNYVQQLFTHFPEASPQVLAQANFLRGDIGTLIGDFTQAAEWFEACAKAVPQTELYYAARGRLGECYYSMGSEQGDNADLLREALTMFNEVIKGAPNKSIEEKARYRAAKIYEILKMTAEAKEEYRNIFHRVEEGAVQDWFYYARAGFDLARMNEEERNYSQAERIYRILASSKTPIAEDARKKAAQLRDSYLKGGE
jgi:tetratricopeptide (TPR) repeat protein